MRAALTDNQPLDFCSAGRAGFAGAPVDAEMILELTAAVNPVNAGAVASDAFLERFPDRGPQMRGLFLRDLVGPGEWMQFGAVQGLICVDVAETGDELLVEEQRLELPLSGPETCVQPFGGERVGERLRSEVPEDFGGIGHQPDAAEFARVAEDERGVVREFEDESVMCAGLVSAEDGEQVPAHAQVDEKAEG